MVLDCKYVYTFHNHPTIRPMSATAPPASPQHLVLPFAQTGGNEDEAPPLAPWPSPLRQHWPHLHALLQEARTQTWHRGSLASRTPPHEWALAHAQGRLATLPARLPDEATLPWAAWDAAHLLPHAEAAAAWFMPAHQEVGMDHVSLHPPETLALDDATSQQLMQALAPFALEDGITLHWVSAHRWLAVGDVFTQLTLASPDRVTSPSGERSIAPWMADLPPSLRRLQTEAQMLFYTHPAHDARVAKHLPPVNSLWIAGTGAASTSIPSLEPVAVYDRLRAAALSGDARGWLAAWAALDAEVLPHWLRRARQGEPVTVSLCGERHILQLGFISSGSPSGTMQKIKNFFANYRNKDGMYSL